MAAAARPGPPDARDARVPCPLCGGLIHPIAGKCKHCKADLTAYHAARPAASTPLPALHEPGAGHANGQPVHPPVAHAVPLPAVHDAAQPVLPPRPTTRAHTVQPAATTWKTWPVVVIVVATMAIVAAVVLMMWPAGRNHDGKRVLQPPPAPERMDTQTPPVLPKVDPPAAPAPAQTGSAAQDPWSMNQADPPPDQSAQVDPDDDPDLDASAPVDPFGSQHGPASRGRHAITLNASGRLVLAMQTHLCRRLAECTNDTAMQSRCDALSHRPAPPPASCPAVQRCLHRLDTLDCSAQPDMMQVGIQLMRFGDCAVAARC